MTSSVPNKFTPWETDKGTSLKGSWVDQMTGSSDAVFEVLSSDGKNFPVHKPTTDSYPESSFQVDHAQQYIVVLCSCGQTTQRELHKSKGGRYF